MSTEVALQAVALVLLLGGFISIIFPVFPGIPFMFLVALGYGFATDFTEVGSRWLWVFGTIAALSIIIDYTLGVLGSKFGGATKKAALWGFIGAVIGSFTIPILGTFLGLFIGIAAAEISQFREMSAVLKAGVSGVVGSLIGMLLNILLAVTFYALFLVAIF